MKTRYSTALATVVPTIITLPVILMLLIIGVTISCTAHEEISEIEGANTSLAMIQQERIAEKSSNAQLSPAIEKGDRPSVYIDPMYEEFKKERGVYYVTGRYYLDSIEVDQTIDAPPIIDDIGALLANILIKIGGNIELDMDPLPVDLSDIDFDVVKDIRVKRIFVNIKDNPSGKANLKFLKQISLMLDHNGDRDKEITDHSQNNYHSDLTGNQKASHQKIVLVNFNKKKDLHNKNSEACDWQCIDFEVTNANLINLIKNKSEIYVRPKVKIGSISKKSFVLGGYVEFSIGLKLDL
ncbi:MAG: hypothetical protein HN353_04855 [Bdellovibrionales bacterium]|nr:hypothetical protein [Bdellovibrionales bacterium]MBT3527384.1 hypothetical protein [Bdellovibrionales bacterium]MBT7670508.1 hypothetical protein [Bdellovibrionales bacterium]MBT7766364.1 hypothetical protein [Bdellovibrionales bacterium]